MPATYRGVMLFAELIRQKLPYASKETVGHGYQYKLVLFSVIYYCQRGKKSESYKLI